MLIKSDVNTFLSNLRFDSFSAFWFKLLSLTFKVSIAITRAFIYLMLAAAYVNLTFFIRICAYVCFFHSPITTAFFYNIIC